MIIYIIALLIAFIAYIFPKFSKNIDTSILKGIQTTEKLIKKIPIGYEKTQQKIQIKYRNTKPELISIYKELLYAYDEWYSIIFIIWLIGFFPVAYMAIIGESIILWTVMFIYIGTGIYGWLSKNTYKKTVALYEYFLDKTYQIDKIDIILMEAKIIQSLLQKYNGIFYTKRLLRINIKFIQNILIDLRSDLSIRLTEQKSTLESAKSEVEKNISGTAELESVSELQKARLDRQIEQFEELQRVLVKV